MYAIEDFQQSFQPDLGTRHEFCVRKIRAGIELITADELPKILPRLVSSGALVAFLDQHGTLVERL